MVGSDTDALDEPGPQRPAAVQKPPLDQCRVPDQLAVDAGERVHATEAVFPVLVGEPSESGVQQGPRRPQRRLVQLGGVRDPDPVHPARLVSCVRGFVRCEDF